MTWFSRARCGLVASFLALCNAALAGDNHPPRLPDFPDWPEAAGRLQPGIQGQLHFPTASPFDLDVILRGMQEATPTTGMGYLRLPSGASAARPVPAMVILPGSGGITPGREREYAAWLTQSLGVAAFVVEYYLPRGATEDLPYLLRTSAVTDFDVVSDAYHALLWLSTSPEIDGGRIGVMGFSYGGMAARFAMDERIRGAIAPQHPGFALHVDFYGPCFQHIGTTATSGAPLLTLRGSEDASVDLQACRRLEDELRALGAEVEAHVYRGAGHAWEADRPREMNSLPYVAGCEVRYDQRGYPHVRGQALLSADTDSSRQERFRARLHSGSFYEGCLEEGYIVGRDSKATARGYRDLQAFLERHFELEDRP